MRGLWARVAWATTEALCGSSCEVDGTEVTQADQWPAPSTMAYSSLKLGHPPAAGSLGRVPQGQRGIFLLWSLGIPGQLSCPWLGGALCGVEWNMCRRSRLTAIWEILQNGGARPGPARGCA